MISHSVIALAVAGFFPLLGNDSELDLTLLDVEHRIRRVTLREDNLSRQVLGQGSATIHCRKKCLRVKWGFFHLLCHDRSLAPRCADQRHTGPRRAPMRPTHRCNCRPIRRTSICHRFRTETGGVFLAQSPSVLQRLTPSAFGICRSSAVGALLRFRTWTPLRQLGARWISRPPMPKKLPVMGGNVTREGFQSSSVQFCTDRPSSTVPLWAGSVDWRRA